jgi:hypothetical protein
MAEAKTQRVYQVRRRIIERRRRLKMERDVLACMNFATARDRWIASHLRDGGLTFSGLREMLAAARSPIRPTGAVK